MPPVVGTYLAGRDWQSRGILHDDHWWGWELLGPLSLVGNSPLFVVYVVAVNGEGPSVEIWYFSGYAIGYFRFMKRQTGVLHTLGPLQFMSFSNVLRFVVGFEEGRRDFETVGAYFGMRLLVLQLAVTAGHFAYLRLDRISIEDLPAFAGTVGVTLEDHLFVLLPHCNYN